MRQVGVAVRAIVLLHIFTGQANSFSITRRLSTRLPQFQNPPDCVQDGYFVNEDDCHTFWVCRKGRAYPFNCPPTSNFNPDTKICVWNDGHTDCSSLTTPTPTPFYKEIEQVAGGYANHLTSLFPGAKLVHRPPKVTTHVDKHGNKVTTTTTKVTMHHTLPVNHPLPSQHKVTESEKIEMSQLSPEAQEMLVLLMREQLKQKFQTVPPIQSTQEEVYQPRGVVDVQPINYVPPVLTPPYVPPTDSKILPPPQQTTTGYIPPSDLAGRVGADPYVPPLENIYVPPSNTIEIPASDSTYTPPTKVNYVSPSDLAGREAAVPYVPPQVHTPNVLQDIPVPPQNIYVPPPTDTVYVPPPTDTVYVPPPTDTVYVPPPTDTVYVPPPTDTVYVPPPTNTVYVPPPLDTKIPPPPQIDPNYVPPVELTGRDAVYVPPTENFPLPSEIIFNPPPPDNNNPIIPSDSTYIPPSDTAYVPPQNTEFVEKEATDIIYVPPPSTSDTTYIPPSDIPNIPIPPGTYTPPVNDPNYVPPAETGLAGREATDITYVPPPTDIQNGPILPPEIEPLPPTNPQYIPPPVNEVPVPYVPIEPVNPPLTADTVPYMPPPPSTVI